MSNEIEEIDITEEIADINMTIFPNCSFGSSREAAIIKLLEQKAEILQCDFFDLEVYCVSANKLEDKIFVRKKPNTPLKSENK